MVGELHFFLHPGDVQQTATSLCPQSLRSIISHIFNHGSLFREWRREFMQRENQYEEAQVKSAVLCTNQNVQPGQLHGGAADIGGHR